MSKVALLLGAGASVDAGAPDVTGLVRSFCESAPERLRQLLKNLIGSLRDRYQTVDVELLLEALDQLIQRDVQVLAAFVEEGGWATAAQADLAEYTSLRKELYSHIRRKLAISSGSTTYLDPIAELASIQEGLDVFSLNYDAAIEMVCERLDVPYTDGFDPKWNPALFDDARFLVRLHKLHGSLLWYRVGNRPGAIERMPLNPSRGFDAEHFTGEKLQEVLLYPATADKSTYTEPHASLVERFRRVLATAEALVCIGYSFRDRHIKSLVLEHMHSNPSLYLVILDPDAAGTLNRSDERLADPWRFRPVQDRIFCLPEFAKDALSEHRLRDFLRALRPIRTNRLDLELTRREQARTNEVDAFRGLLAASIRIGWGLPIALSLGAPQGSIEYEAAQRLIQDFPGPPTAPQLLGLCAALCRNADELRSQAQKAYKGSMERLGRIPAVEWAGRCDHAGFRQAAERRSCRRVLRPPGGRHNSTC